MVTIQGGQFQRGYRDPSVKVGAPIDVEGILDVLEDVEWTDHDHRSHHSPACRKVEVDLSPVPECASPILFLFLLTVVLAFVVQKLSVHRPAAVADHPPSWREQNDSAAISMGSLDILVLEIDAVGYQEGGTVVVTVMWFSVWAKEAHHNAMLDYLRSGVIEEVLVAEETSSPTVKTII